MVEHVNIKAQGAHCEWQRAEGDVIHHEHALCGNGARGRSVVGLPPLYALGAQVEVALFARKEVSLKDGGGKPATIALELIVAAAVTLPHERMALVAPQRERG